MNVTNNCGINGSTGGNFINANKRKKLPVSLFDDDIIEDELGTETEAEKHMKLLLQKQLNTKLSLKQQFDQHKSFTCPSTYTPLTELVKGSCSLEKFKETEKDEEVYQELQQCGLSEEEIHLYLTSKKQTDCSKKLIEPGIWKEKLESIERKIETHHKDLNKPQVFSGVKQLSRHEMELEKTLYAGCVNKNMLAPLVSVINSCSSDTTDNVFSHIKKLSQNLLQKCNKRRKGVPGEIGESSDLKNNSQEFIFDPNIHHVVVPLEDEEIEKNRISIDEIRQLPRFGSYEPGEASKVLYLQNLNPKLNIQELQALFVRFEEENMAPLQYRLMTGKMRGQAFITFTDSKVAEKALNFATGYILRQKPIIIKYGRKN